MVESWIGLDQNMVSSSQIGDTEVNWLDARKPPFALHGLYKPQTEPFFHRLPEDVGIETSDAVAKLQKESAGGRVRFSTDSPFIAIRAKFLVVGRSSHLTLVSSAGFDLYRDGDFGPEYVREFRMPYDMTDAYEQLIPLPVSGRHFYTIHFPVHSVVEKLEIGLAPGSFIGGERPYLPLAPIVFYGSSIVHGTAASRPGLTYENGICRQLNIDYMNLGFSGHAMGEAALGRYMATLPMSIFVCDYDHNAPSVAHLEATHYPLYEIIRKKNPALPYVMITRPNYYTAILPEDVMRRRDVVLRSYLRARDNGDTNVYLIDGMSFFANGTMYDNTMDHVHPNDLGFAHMADEIGAVLRHILSRLPR